MPNLLRPPFIPFDREKVTRVYRRNLPHWRQEGATYFVTFRLADALPHEALRRLEHEEALWLQARGLDTSLDRKTLLGKLNSQDRSLYRKVFNRRREEMTDSGFGECYLDRPEVVETVRTQILKDDADQLHIGDFVLMPNHIHLLIIPQQRELEDCMKRINGASATLCNRLLNRAGTFWQPDSFDHIVRDLERREKARNYIRDNPKNAGIKVPESAYYRAAWM